MTDPNIFSASLNGLSGASGVKSRDLRNVCALPSTHLRKCSVPNLDSFSLQFSSLFRSIPLRSHTVGI